MQHAVDAIGASGLDEIVIVLGFEADLIARELKLPPSARIVVNPEYEEGQSTSLRVGLDSVDPCSDAAVILLGDQPRLPAWAIKRAVAAFEATGSTVVRALWEGTPGHPVIVARSRWKAFREVREDMGARDLISSLTHEDVEMGEPPIEDIDTWEQYEKIRKAQ